MSVCVQKRDYTAWFLNNLLHREDGPAIEWADGSREWYWRGKELDVNSQEEFEKMKSLLQIQEVQES